MVVTYSTFKVYSGKNIWVRVNEINNEEYVEQQSINITYLLCIYDVLYRARIDQNVIFECFPLTS